MDKKPLIPYSPNAHRSRLAQPPAPLPAKNASSIVFDEPGMFTCHKRRFVTTSALTHSGDPVDPRSNTAIIAEATRIRRQQLAK